MRSDVVPPSFFLVKAYGGSPPPFDQPGRVSLLKSKLVVGCDGGSGGSGGSSGGKSGEGCEGDGGGDDGGSGIGGDRGGGDSGKGRTGGDGGVNGGDSGDGGTAPPPQTQHIVFEEKSVSS